MSTEFQLAIRAGKPVVFETQKMSKGPNPYLGTRWITHEIRYQKQLALTFRWKFEVKNVSAHLNNVNQKDGRKELQSAKARSQKSTIEIGC